ncbi:hypothetical protein Fcan01_12903 [Folsomia candida]|uniref:D-serine dehydratase-like domain-containing protein n=1 Tax=Folsomia candida TaxID=158441 RepID=A0A226E0Y5_FOLCA|nr:hypothetical protein Fcan01_12903 [Folsomia candida]
MAHTSNIPKRGGNRFACLELLRLGKGVGRIDNSTSCFEKWDLLKEDISLPAAILDMEKFSDNLAWMEKFINKFEAPIKIAPHGKTTMSPNLFHHVISQPSTWGLTLATASQVRVAHEFGVSKVLLANQLIGKRNMDIISEIMSSDENFDFLCTIDSSENVEQLGQFFSERKQKLKVLLEYGPPNGRTGVRNEKQEAEVLKTLTTWSDTIDFVGVEFFEGVLSLKQDVSDFVDYITERTAHLIKAQCFNPNFAVTITGSGSVWFDIVAEKLTTFFQSTKATTTTPSIQIILRPGCYMIHDVGMYTEISSRIKFKQLMDNSELQPALKIWAYVQSIPEKDVAIVGFGRRDAGHDSGFPKPALHFRPWRKVVGSEEVGTEEVEIKRKLEVVIPDKWELFRMMDQHSFMRIGEGDDVEVGDMVAFDIIHACTTFDKWRNIVIVDNEKDMSTVDIYQTFF